jgi:hypothetical protein
LDRARSSWHPEHPVLGASRGTAPGTDARQNGGSGAAQVGHAGPELAVCGQPRLTASGEACGHGPGSPVTGTRGNRAPVR